MWLAICLSLVAGSDGSGQAPKAAIANPDTATFWCPMHPDVRGRAGDKCPQCGMALVRTPATDTRPYTLDFEMVPRALRPLQTGRVRFFVRDPRTGGVVRRFSLVHERVFHLFIISRDLDHFAHVHPRLHANGLLDVEVTVPRPGAYQLIADFLPEGGAPQLVQRSFVTAGYTAALAAVPALRPDAADKVVGGTRVKLTMPEPFAGREQLITFDVLDETTGAPAGDLEPYLGATGHLLVASADLAVASHAHPIADINGSRSNIVFEVLFPRPGDYRLWVQFQRRGQVITTAFTVPVPSLSR
jgi:hypothetical protein